MDPNDQPTPNPRQLAQLLAARTSNTQVKGTSSATAFEGVLFALPTPLSAFGDVQRFNQGRCTRNRLRVPTNSVSPVVRLRPAL